jgi:hypothetical protein
MEHEFRVGLKPRPTMKSSLSAADHGRTSLITPCENQHYRCSQFDATKLRDFMEFQGQLKIPFPPPTKTIYALR